MSTIRQAVGRDTARLARAQAFRSMEDNKREVLAPLDITFKADGGGDLTSSDRIPFEGMANVGTVDRYGDIIQPRAFRRSLKSFLQNNPIVLYMHDRWMPVGQIKQAKITQDGLWVSGYIIPAVDEDGLPLQGTEGAFMRHFRSLVRHKVVRTLSVSFYILSKQDGEAADPMWPEKTRKVRVITDLELLEISFVTLPGSRESTVQVEGELKSLFGEAIYKSLFYEPDSEIEVDSENEVDDTESEDHEFEIVDFPEELLASNDFEIVEFDRE